jgi:hypothetical protein
MNLSNAGSGAAAPVKCPGCRYRKLREPQVEDPVYLLTKDAITSASVEDILTQNGIPCIKKAQLGAGLTAYVGYSLETFRFFVPFGALAAAKDLLSNFIDESDD